MAVSGAAQAEAALEAEKARLKAWYQAQLEEVAAKAKASYDAQLEALRDQLRQEVVSSQRGRRQAVEGCVIDQLS